MKAALILLTALSTSTAFAANNTCTYKLDQEEYWENASGDLSFGGREYRCESLMIGEDSVTLCKDKAKIDSPNYDLVVSFDGAEADFGVYNTLYFNLGGTRVLCAGQAETK